MGKKKTRKTIEAIIGISSALMGNESIQNFLCGTYADGTQRSVTDAINGEIYSPKQKAKSNKRTKKRKKKKKKNKNITIDFFD